jgi:hypothetical protein
MLDIIILLRQFPNIQEYVKYVQLINTTLSLNFEINAFIFIEIKTGWDFTENKFLITSFYLHEMLNSVINLLILTS